MKYDAAMRAIAEAKAVDEILLIHDQARAMAAAARIAKNREAEINMAEIRIRATRRLGEMMEQGKTDRACEGRPKKRVSEKPISSPPTLKEIGIGKTLAHRARKLATHPEKKFVQMMKEWRTEAVESADPVASIVVKACWTAKKAKKKKQRIQDFDRQVADFLDAEKKLRDAMKTAREAREKFSTEAIRFTIRRLDALRREIDAFEEDLAAEHNRKSFPKEFTAENELKDTLAEVAEPPSTPAAPRSGGPD